MQVLVRRSLRKKVPFIVESTILEATKLKHSSTFFFQFHGKGTLIGPTGIRYIGEFRDGMRDGPGLLDYGDGSSYDGMWKQDKVSINFTKEFD